MQFLFAIAVFVLSVDVSADTLDPIIVLGSEEPEVGEVEHSEFTGTYEHIDVKDVQRRSDSIAELISHESGVQYRQAGGIGSFSSITLRGATAAQTNVYFDGVLLNDASNGSVDLSQFELLNLDSIDVYRGSTPIQLSAGGIGGAVNLRSQKSRAKKTGILIGLGSFNEQKIQLSHQNIRGNQDSTTAFSHVRSNNDFPFTYDINTALTTEDDRREKRFNNEFSRTSLLFKLGKQINPQQRYDGSFQFSDRNQALPNSTNDADTDSSLDTSSLQLQVNRRSSATENELWNHTEGLYLNRSFQDYDDPEEQNGLGFQKTSEITDIVGGRVYWEKIGTTSTLALNLDLRSERLDHDDLLGTGVDYKVSRSGLNGAMQYSLFKIGERLLLTPALRLQSINDKYTGIVREGSNSYSNTTLTPQIGFRWEHSESMGLSANIGQHYREPVFFELFGDRGLYIGNGNLSAEEGINVDLGIQWMDQENVDRSFAVTGFASFRDELIVSVFDAQNTGRSVNSGKAQILGLEGKINWRWGKYWFARLNMTVQSAKNLSNVSSLNGKQLPGEAQFVSYGKLAYQRETWSLWYELDILNDRFYDEVNILPAEDQTIHNVGFSYTNGSLRSTLLLRNLGDDIIEDYNGFPKPGRSIHFNLTYTFDGDRQ